MIRYAVLPQILPSLLANALFRFEVNVRAAVLLGAVGAGGIGYELYIAMSALEYRRATIAIGASLLLVIISERTADFFRARILGGGQRV
jgi:phosphonate transport system permease protein